MIRVLVADDQEMARSGLQLILAADDDIEVVDAVADGRAAVRRAVELVPSVCLLDVRMPGLDGVAACRAITDQLPATKVVIITTFESDEVVDASLAAGACGFLLKSASGALVREAVRAAASGDSLVAPEVTAELLRRMSESSRVSAHRPPEPVDALTQREEEVLVKVAEGLTNAEVATALHVSVSTVKTHVNSLTTKLAVRNRVELAAFAFRSGRVE